MKSIIAGAILFGTIGVFIDGGQRAVGGAILAPSVKRSLNDPARPSDPQRLRWHLKHWAQQPTESAIGLLRQ